MRLNQNETEKRGARSEERGVSRVAIPARRDTAHSAFTLTELLVVIAIIATLAGLITAAAVGALGAGKQAAITFELQQISNALEDFKNEHGVYPPNVYRSGDVSSSDQGKNDSNLLLALKRISTRSTEFNIGANVDTPANNISNILQLGLSPAEAVVFWLSGFSNDETRPLTGTDLSVVSIDDGGSTINNVITFDAFPNPLYEFDVSRLRYSRDSTGTRRFITVNRNDAAGTEVYIQLYEYLPDGSEEPFVYFDTSRDTPSQMVANWETSEFFYVSRRASDGIIFPLKQERPDAPSAAERNPPQVQYLEYVNRDRFQLLHCGIDDLWGNFSVGGALDLSDGNNIPTLLFPDGPFIGEVADTVGNFITGTLEDEQE